MTSNLTTPQPVTLTATRPSGLVTVTGQDLLLPVTPVTGHPAPRAVTLTGHPAGTLTGHPVVTADPVTLTAPEVTTVTDTPPTPTAPVTPVTWSPGHGDQVTAQPPRRGLFRRRNPSHAAQPAPAAPAVEIPKPAAGKAKPDPLPKWLDRSEMSVLWAVAGVVTYLASFGQVHAAEKIDITDHRKWLVPVGLELVAIALFLRGYVVGRQGFSPWPAWIAGLGVGGFAVYQVHEHAPNPDQGVLFGAFTAGALVLWLGKLMYALWKFRRDSNTSAAGHLKFGKLWRDNPRLTRHAARIGRRFQLDDIDTAMEYAEVMVAVLDDTKTANAMIARQIEAKKSELPFVASKDERRKIEAEVEALRQRILSGKERRRTAWRATQKHAGRKVAKLPSFAAVDRIVVEDPTPTPAPATVDVPATPTQPAPTRAPAAPAPAPRRRPSPAEGVEQVVQEWTAVEQGRMPRPANAPVSPAPAVDVRGAALRQYDAVFKLLDKLLDGWKTRTDKVTAGDLKRIGICDAAGTLITGKPTLNKIAWLVETESVRVGDVSDEIWTKYRWTREG